MQGTYKPITDIKQIQELRKLIGWDPLSRKQWQEVLDKSSWVYSVWDKNRLIGMGRAVTDGRNCILYDVIVHKHYHRQGIGKMIINGLIKKAEKKYAHRPVRRK